MKICCVTTCRRPWGPTQSAHMCRVRPRTSCLSAQGDSSQVASRPKCRRTGRDYWSPRQRSHPLTSRTGRRDGLTQVRSEIRAPLDLFTADGSFKVFSLSACLCFACVRACRKSKSTPWLFYLCFANRDCYEDGSNLECPFNYPLVKWKVFSEGRNKQPDLITSKHCQRSFQLWNWRT